MKSRTTRDFRRRFANLPRQIQQQARAAYRQFQQDPSHPGLRFKKVHPELPIYSARVSKNYGVAESGYESIRGQAHRQT